MFDIQVFDEISYTVRILDARCSNNTIVLIFNKYLSRQVFASLYKQTFNDVVRAKMTIFVPHVEPKITYVL